MKGQLVSNKIVTAVEMADAVGVDPKTFRQALRDQHFSWHRHNERWEVEEGSAEHQDMRHVLATLTNSNCERGKTSAAAFATSLRPDESPLAGPSLAEQNWLAAATMFLTQIDENRRVENMVGNSYCIFDFDDVYFQCLAPPDHTLLFCEAVSAESVPEIGRILAPEKEDRLIREFGFAAPGNSSPNFSREIEVKSVDDLDYVARVAYRVLRDIYGVKDFGTATFKVVLRGTVDDN
jgi:hypothetical protein